MPIQNLIPKIFGGLKGYDSPFSYYRIFASPGVTSYPRGLFLDGCFILVPERTVDNNLKSTTCLSQNVKVNRLKYMPF
jgi:hypothetical protein